MNDTVRALALVSLTVLVSPVSARDDAFRVVVRDDNPVPHLTSEEVSALFLGKTAEWADGTPVLPVEGRDEDLRDSFARAVHGKSAAAIQSYWHRQVFSGEETPPTRVGSDLEVLEYVKRNRGAIGYVSAAAPRAAGVRSLAISDLATLADADPSWGSGSSAPRADVTAERGPIRLLLTGSCGPGGEGREAILTNRDRFASNRVEVEVSRWHDGTFRSSSRHGYTLSGGEEKRLGCDRIGAGVELRYALAEVDDSSLSVDRRRARRAPSRDFVAIVESSTCGRQAEGRRMTVVNRHPERAIRVEVETVERVAGTLRRRFTKPYRLGPGDEQRLGCSRDGNLEHEYHLVEAE